MGGTSFNRLPDRDAVEPEKLFADLLKRQARRVMADITECPADTLPAHLARLDGLREVVSHAMRHGLVSAVESRRSDRQLIYAYTVADFAACLEITRREHRAPAFVNSRDSELSEVNRKVDLLAGMVAAALPDGFEMPRAFCPAVESEVGL